MEIKKILITGPCASGKTTLVQNLFRNSRREIEIIYTPFLFEWNGLIDKEHLHTSISKNQQICIRRLSRRNNTILVIMDDMEWSPFCEFLLESNDISFIYSNQITPKISGKFSFTQTYKL